MLFACAPADASEAWNDTFETGASGWAVTGLVRTDAVAHGGNWSMQLPANTTCSMIRMADAYVDTADWLVTFWLKTSAATPNTVFATCGTDRYDPEFSIGCWNSNGVNEGLFSCRIVLGGNPNGWLDTSVPRDDQWHKFAAQSTTSDACIRYFIDDVFQLVSGPLQNGHSSPLKLVQVRSYYATSPDSYFDDVSVYTFGPISVVPDNGNRVPSNGAPNVQVTGVTLSWDAATGATAYDVYLGTSSTSLTKISSAQTTTTCDTGALQNSRNYYWRVDARNDDGAVMPGTVWTFTTPGLHLSLTPVPASAATCSGGGVYDEGASVPISAARKYGYKFKKWSTQSDGSDTVSWTSATNYTMPGTDKALYAIFVPFVDDLIVEAADGNPGTLGGQHPEWYSDNYLTQSAKSTAPGLTGSASRYKNTGVYGPTNAAIYTPDVPAAGYYDVYATWGTSGTAGTQIIHEVGYSGGTGYSVWNQRDSNLGNIWNELGTFYFGTGTDGYVKQYSQIEEYITPGDPASACRVMADGVKFEFVPPKATDPNPGNDDFRVPLTGVVLSWACDNVAAYDVYFGTDSASMTKLTADHPLFDEDGKSIDLSTIPAYATLQTNTWYYWRVDSIGNTVTTEGNLWKFITEGPAGTYFVRPVPNPYGHGTCSGAGYYSPGETAHLIATPADHYDFSKWTSDIDGNNVVSTNAAYDLTVPAADTTLYAQFLARPYDLTLIAVPTAGGTPTGAGSKPFGSSVTVEATANSGYFFLNWTDDTGAVKSRKQSYTFTMPGNDVSLNANYVKAIFAEGFEGLATGTLAMNDIMGPNQAANGDLTSAQPWWGTMPPCGSAGNGAAATVHSGTNGLWSGDHASSHDYVNLAYRCNSQSAFSASIYADWWFYDPCGTKFEPYTTWQGYCDDPLSLVSCETIPTFQDYPDTAQSERFADASCAMKVSLGMADVWTPATAAPYDAYTGFDSSKYQARMFVSSTDLGDVVATGPGAPAPTPYAIGWYNLGLTRSIGWHHGRITMGPLEGTANEFMFYIDDMSSPLLAGMVPCFGINAMELATEWKNGGADTTVRYPKSTTYDDIVVGTLEIAPAAPVAAAASSISDVSIQWNWTEGDTVDGFHVFDAAAQGAQKGNVTATNLPEAGLTSNTAYSRWVSSYLAVAGPNAPYVTFDSARVALASARTLATVPTVDLNVAAPAPGPYGGSWAGLTNPQGFGENGLVSKFKYKWSTNPSDTITEGQGTDWSGGTMNTLPGSDGTWYLYLRSYNQAGVGNGSTKLGAYVFDTQPPTGSIVINNDDATTSNVNVTLTLSSPDATQMKFSNDGTNYDPPVAYATSQSWTLTSGDGLKTVYVKFIDGAGNESIAYSDTIQLSTATPVDKISDLWPLTNGPGYKLTDKVVTGVVGNAFWIEETDRYAAIKVIWNGTMPAQDHAVNVTGVLDSSSGQRVLNASSVTDKGAATPIKALGVVEKSAGGAEINTDTPSITNGKGLYNIGMLVRIAGSAGNSNTADPNNKFFYLDDGSGLMDGAIPGIKVLCGTIAPPTSGTKTVTGLVGVVGGKPVIVIRGTSDIP